MEEHEVFGLRRWATDRPVAGLFADGEVYLPLFLAALAALAGLGFVLYRTRVRCLCGWLPELQLPPLDEADLRELLPWLCPGRRSFAAQKAGGCAALVCRAEACRAPAALRLSPRTQRRLVELGDTAWPKP